MNRKQLIFVVVVILVIVVVAVSAVLLSKKEGGSPTVSLQPGAGPNANAGIQTPPPPKDYVPTVPKDAAVTPPKNEAPASPNPNLDTKIRFYDMKASRNGFEPDSITVKKGDNVRIDLTAVDGSYDVDFPYLGAYFNVIKKGETRQIIFDTSLAGTFNFMCRDYCPASGKIKGQLIVLPK